MGMGFGKEELEDFNQMIGMFVLFYKTIWSEVQKQFSELPQEEKHKIFGVIAPSIVGTLNMGAYDDPQDTPQQKHPQKKKEIKTKISPSSSTINR